MSRVVRCTIKIVAILTIGWISGAQSAPGYKIIVNPANPVDAITEQQLSRLFLKKTSTWRDGTEVQPVDQLVDSDVRETFSQEIMGKPAAMVNHYWQQMIFAGRSLPPVTRLSDASVIEFVMENPGAIGYVSSSTPAEGVKVVAVAFAE
jgi:ABC-type phosphate transport system substrate-binding protein